MPTRMIRESVLDSERYLSVSESERLLFLHLCLLADDLGCISLASAFVGRRAFSERPGEVRLNKMIQALADVDLIRVYEHSGARYAFIPRFRQRLQRETLRYPAPPFEMIKDQKEALEMFNRIKVKFPKTTVGQPLGNRSPTAEVEVEVEEKRSRSEEKSPEGQKPVDNPQGQKRLAGYLYKKPSDL